MKPIDGCLHILKTENIQKESINKQVSFRTVAKLTTNLQGLHASSTRLKGHVMLSYNWSTKELVFQLKVKLNAEGYKTWIDVENMPSGSVIDGMEAAITTAALILICYSDGYKRSANCRMEAEYALKQDKPILFVRAEKGYKPDGWLSFILGQKLYYDLVGKPAIEAQLLKHILELFEGKNPSAGGADAFSKGIERAIDHTKEVQVAASSAPKQEPEFLKWSEDQVQKWLKDKALEFLLEPYALY